MESKYYVIGNNKKKNDVAAEMMLSDITNGMIILSAVAAADSVHYVVGRFPKPLYGEMNGEIHNLQPDSLTASILNGDEQE